MSKLNSTFYSLKKRTFGPAPNLQTFFFVKGGTFDAVPKRKSLFFLMFVIERFKRCSNWLLIDSDWGPSGWRCFGKGEKTTDIKLRYLYKHGGSARGRCCLGDVRCIFVPSLRVSPPHRKRASSTAEHLDLEKRPLSGLYRIFLSSEPLPNG